MPGKEQEEGPLSVEDALDAAAVQAAGRCAPANNWPFYHGGPAVGHRPGSGDRVHVDGCEQEQRRPGGFYDDD